MRLRSKAHIMAAIASALAIVACAKNPAAESAPSAVSPIQSKRGVQAVTAQGEEVVFAHPTAPVRPPASPRDEHLVREPTGPDPDGGRFTLEQAVEGMPIDGTLVAEIATELGTLLCDLYADRAPITVANFIGLARGKRAFWDAQSGAWERRPIYQGTLLHRVIPGFMIQGGDPLNDASSTLGYTLPNERPDGLVHDRAGLLAMAFDGAMGKTSQFFLTDGPAPQLDEGPGYTIFGRCEPADLIARIARVPQSGAPDHRPLTDVGIRRLVIRRVVGGAAAARPTAPRLPEGITAEQMSGPQASPGPSEFRQRSGRGLDTRGGQRAPRPE